MDKSDVLILGGSAAAIVTGSTARKHYKDVSITAIRREKEGELLVPCGLPYIVGTLGSPKKNVMPDALFTNNDVSFVVDEATSIDRGSKTVTTAGGKQFGYEKLVLATGAEPTRLPIPGSDLDNMFWAIKDVSYLNNMLSVAEKAKDVVVIGGGFIGLEFADEFRKKGLNVTIVEVLPHCLQLVFDEDFCTVAESRLAERGIGLRLADRVESIQGNGKVQGVQLASGESLKADLVFMCAGVRPNTTLAQNAGLELGATKAIYVDDYGRTSDKDIFAVGDCAEKRSFFTKKPSALKLASIAVQEARVVGTNLFELRRRNEGVIGTFATIIGDAGVGMSGLTESADREAGFDVVVAEAKTPDKHPGSLPGAAEVRLKLVFERATHQVLGGQACGGATVGELVNVLAALIQNRMTAEQVATFQYGTHPFFTPSPIPYPVANAAEIALST